MLWFFLLFSVVFLRVEAAVVQYNVETVDAAAVAALPADHWAQFNQDAFRDGNCSFVSLFDDAPYFEAINITSPFFSRDAVEWYVSSDGFLAPTPSPMCDFFCTEVALNTLFGNYQFGDTVYGGGGDWPMIGLYVVDLNPSAAQVSWSVRVLSVPGGKAGVDHVIVEYRDVPLTQTTSVNDTLTAQVEVWTNGTIVMRYKHTPTGVNASVGLVLSREERVVVDLVAHTGGVAGVRYEPVMDNCSSLVNESVCLGREGTCGWCAATKMCVATALANKSCPHISFRTQSPPLALDDDYYDVVVEQGAELVDVRALGGRELLNTSVQALRLEMGFDFPFYTVNQTSHVTNTTYLLSSGLISVFSASQECGPIWNMCPNGNYSFTIMPFVATEQWVSKTSVTYALLPERVQGDVLCKNVRCPLGLVIEVANTTAIASRVRSSNYQIYLDASGAVEFRYGLPVAARIPTGPVVDFFSFPSPFVGLFRHRVEDPATIAVPLSLVRTGTRIRFDPRGKCNDCGRNGVCDSVTYKCSCNDGFTGDFCEQCSVDHYGPRCLPCGACENKGFCDDGVNGTGSCVCPKQFSGRKCEVSCDEPFDCTGCNLRGGYCECGVCRCDTASGWGGPHCDVLLDPCRQYSFDGCEVCSNDTANKCTFCFDSMCYSALLNGGENEYTCSHTVPGEDASLCVPAVQKEMSQVDLDYIILFLLIVSAFVCSVLFVVFTRLGMRRYSLYDIHAAGASGGVPDHKPGRREREVVQAVFVQKNALKDKGRHVLGVPLKQISLQRLYESQRNAQSKRD
ncbi:uncharacterized protein TM35_000661030 [Trypanosoma theileri]|uniref:EGF-like domain-containing protein n=1 Tax=Trypanosoma theileri TaxID=67003 RepID=A0A1X0NFL6_9TRYP|nr:uncharacterized protein TM35_000661030 [Trypanosoma theileri]ORC83524.1 hypothetical protein TM35_000661030 [Trypanosoma theileri]